MFFAGGKPRVFVGFGFTFEPKFHAMVELTIKLPEQEMPFLLALLKRLNFVEFSATSSPVATSKAQFLDDFEQSLKDVKLHMEGKIKLPTIEEVLNEL